jgi:hypothetical protein
MSLMGLDSFYHEIMMVAFENDKLMKRIDSV